MKVRITLALALLSIASMAVAADRSAADDKYADLTFVVVKNSNGKPVRNAAVVLHPVGANGKQARGGAELKTDPDGKASYPSVPYGKLRIQVIAHGYQTWGEDVDISQPQHEFVIKLLPPAQQYSIYDDHPKDGAGNGANKPSDNPADKPASDKDKPPAKPPQS